MNSVKLLLVLMLAWLFAAMPLHAQTFPPLTDRVVDAANILPEPEEAALNAQLKTLEDQTGRQLVVATVPDLQGYPVEDYGYRLGRAWGIGEKGKNTGLILLVAPNERKIRIEVGYGLEPIMTDALSHKIIQREIRPRFKEGNLPAGIQAGVNAMIPQLTLPPEEAAKRAAAAAEPRQSSGDVDLGGIIFWLFIFFFFILPVVRSLFGGKRGRAHRGGSGPVIIWGGGSDWGGGSSGGSSWSDSFSGGGGDFGGGGASGDW